MSGFIILESASYVYPEVYRTSFLHKSVAHRFEVESSILLIQRIANPEVDLPVPLRQADTAIQRSVD